MTVPCILTVLLSFTHLCCCGPLWLQQQPFRGFNFAWQLADAMYPSVDLQVCVDAVGRDKCCVHTHGSCYHAHKTGTPPSLSPPNRRIIYNPYTA